MNALKSKSAEQESKAVAHDANVKHAGKKGVAYASPVLTSQFFSSPAHFQTIPAIQMTKAEIVSDMPKGIKEAVEFLNEYDGDKKISDYILPVIIGQLELVEKSEYAKHCAVLISEIRAKIPVEKQQKDEPVPLHSKAIHGIWVQGDYTVDEEFRAGIETRKDSKAQEWVNLIWVYQSMEKMGELDSMAARKIVVDGVNLFEVDFKATITMWEDKPKWVEHFLPILDVLLEKKSFVTMSDIMRMIILYYKGGLYQDVKIQLTTKDARFFDEPMVNQNKLQLVDAGHKENWAMVAEAGCEMISKIMTATLSQFPSVDMLETMPVNYSNQGQYSKAHKSLHENLGPWHGIERENDHTDTIGFVNPSLKLRNPRPVNSWANDDGVDFDWGKKPVSKEVVEQPSVWREMSSNIMGLPPHAGDLTPQHVLLELRQSEAFDEHFPDFWAAYDDYRTNNPEYRYKLSPVQVIKRINGASPTSLYIMSQEDWRVYAQYKIDYPEFVYD